jgi:ketosteroid isomerase-like protein
MSALYPVGAGTLAPGLPLGLRASPRAEVARRFRRRTNRDLCSDLLDAYRPGRMEQLLELLDPEIVWITTEGWVERETWHGHDGVRAGLERFFAEWSEFSDELEQFREAGDRFAVWR